MPSASSLAPFQSLSPVVCSQGQGGGLDDAVPGRKRRGSPPPSPAFLSALVTARKKPRFQTDKIRFVTISGIKPFEVSC